MTLAPDLEHDAHRDDDHDDHHPDRTLALDVAAAAATIAPLFPLSSFVAVNPLRGFEDRAFDDACGEGRRWFGGRTHLPIDDARTLLRRGEVRHADLRAAVIEHDPIGASRTLPGGRLTAADVLVHDLVDGPLTTPARTSPGGPGRSAWHAAVASYVGTWAATFADDHAGVALPDRELGFFRAWRRMAASDRRLRDLVGRAGRRWVATLPDRAEDALAVACDALGLEPPHRADALRAALTVVPGWAGHARWAEEWGDGEVRLTTIDLLAVLVAIDAAAGRAGLVIPPPVPPAADHALAARVRSALGRLAAAGHAPHDELERVVTDVLAGVDDDVRRALWLRAVERATRDRIISRLASARSSGAPGAPDAQIVCCIDVRSEPLRRHIEATGAYETFGFAGFFGVAARWIPAGSDQGDARCPVLLTPGHDVLEIEIAPDRDRAVASLRGASRDAFHAGKASFGGPFALAEAAGWVAGPLAAARAVRRPRRHLERRGDVGTRAAVATEQHASSGFDLADRVRIAESILRTIGLSSFAPLVVLCGHGSHTVNNAHATALACGACGGAPGGASARMAATILNDPAVRAGLGQRGIDVPASTWFVAAEHDTVSDAVTLLDVADVPRTHLDRTARLDRDLALAGERTAHERAVRLPGPADAVRARGRDWAQVRPEWGLAGNAAFLAAPRRVSTGAALDGRVFLHSYDADTDPDGAVLTQIMTAPLVVAQWINAQYYFSSVDLDVFGAGDKLLHNPVGSVGVLRGPDGDLAVGLPLQSVAVDGELAHPPVRLLAMIQAPLDRIESVIAGHDGLRALLDGGWIALVGRAHDTDEWSQRQPGGTWVTWIPSRDLAGAVT